MPLKSDKLIERLRLADRDVFALKIVPEPESLKDPQRKGTAAVDLRLGRWFLSLRQSRATILEVKEREGERPAMPRLAAEILEMRRKVTSMPAGHDRRARERLIRHISDAVDLEKLEHEVQLEELNRDADSPARLSKYYFVPFGDKFILHPGQFVLGITFEWLKFPCDVAGFVTGKSSWGRRGLIIETAAESILVFVDV